MFVYDNGLKILFMQFCNFNFETDFPLDMFLPHVTASRCFPSCGLQFVPSFYKPLLLALSFKSCEFIFIGTDIVVTTGLPA